MANWCTTYYAILTKKNYEGLAQIWEQLKLGRAVIHYKDTEILVDHVGAIVDEPAGRYFLFKVETKWKPCHEYMDELVAAYDDIHYIYTAEELGTGLYMTNDIHKVFVTEAWCIDAYVEPYVLKRRPELQFIDECNEYPGEKEGRQFLQQLLNTDERDTDALLNKLEQWNEQIQAEFPAHEVYVYAHHIDSDYDHPATIDSW